jgi:methionyl-tRNA formyltransferase
MDDPIQTKSFISKLIDARRKDIVGLAVSEGNRLTIQKNKSKYEYILSLLLIMGFFHFIKNSFFTVLYELKKIFYSKLPSIINNPSVKAIADNYGIRTWQIDTPNNKNFLDEIRKLDVDVIINQSQNILKGELLSIPKIGVINRHNALLPMNRGRLTPFWVLYKGEKETGVSIHFVTEELDAGDIIVQKRFPVTKRDNFNSIVKKNYELALIAMLEALDKLENGEKIFIKNASSFASYNSTPNIREAWVYRKRRFIKFFDYWNIIIHPNL